MQGPVTKPDKIKGMTLSSKLITLKKRLGDLAGSLLRVIKKKKKIRPVRRAAFE